MHDNISCGLREKVLEMGEAFQPSHFLLPSQVSQVEEKNHLQRIIQLLRGDNANSGFSVLLDISSALQRVLSDT